MANYRNLTSSNVFHVLNRGVDGQDIFFLHDDRAFWEAMIAQLADRHGVRIEAYAWMTNHYHLLVDISACGPEALSAFMRDLQSAYAIMLNERTLRRGPLFQSRFVAIPVEGDAQYLSLARYIHRNPIDITGERGVAAYAYSSLAVYLGHRRPPEWLDVERLSAMVDRGRYLRRVIDSDPDDFFPRSFRPALEASNVDDLVGALPSVEAGLVSSCERRIVVDLIAEILISMRLLDIVELADRLATTPKTLRNRAARAKAMLSLDSSTGRVRERIVRALLEPRL